MAFVGKRNLRPMFHNPVDLLETALGMPVSFLRI